MEDLDFGSLYENFEKEQAYLSAEKEQVPVYFEYYSKVLRFYYTPDELPVYILCVGITNGGDIKGIVFKSYEPAFVVGEEVVLPHSYVTIVDIDVTEVKNRPEILF